MLQTFQLVEHGHPMTPLKCNLVNRIFKDENVFAKINEMTPDSTRTRDERLQFKDFRLNSDFR